MRRRLFPCKVFNVQYNPTRIKAIIITTHFYNANNVLTTEDACVIFYYLMIFRHLQNCECSLITFLGLLYGIYQLLMTYHAYWHIHFVYIRHLVDSSQLHLSNFHSFYRLLCYVRRRKTRKKPL